MGTYYIWEPISHWEITLNMGFLCLGYMETPIYIHRSQAGNPRKVRLFTWSGFVDQCRGSFLLHRSETLWIYRTKHQH